MSFSSSSYPYDTVVYITDEIDGQFWQASGVLIAPDEVLTAAHVVYSSTYGVATDITVAPAYNLGTTPYGTATGTVIHYNPISDPNNEITTQQSQYDYAVIHLSTSFSTLGTMGLDPNFQGGLANLTGYPGYLDGQQETVQEDFTPNPYYTVLDGSSIGAGSSGGPVWVLGPNGLPEVIGLVSSGEAGVDSPGFFSEITPAALAQIEAWVAQDNPAPPPPTTPRTVIATPAVLTLSLSTAMVIAGQMGAAWQAFATLDFSGDGHGDIAWQTNESQVYDWTMNGDTIAGLSLSDGEMGAGWQIAGTGDFNGDGRTDILWQDNGTLAIWEMDGSQLSGFGQVMGGQMGAAWQVAATGDLTGDGMSDVIWTNNDGQIAVWEINGTVLAGFGIPSGQMGAEWHVAGTGDFYGNGQTEVLWANNNGQIAEWTMNGANLESAVVSDGQNGPAWQVAGVADFNDDGMSDVIWANGSGQVDIWFMNGANVTQSVMLSGQMGAGWHIVGVKDLTGAGTPDILWANASGQIDAWMLGLSGDLVTGGNPQDTFTFNQIADAGMEITDFQPGVGGGVLNLQGLFGSIGYSGGNPLGDGEVRLVQNGANTDVQVDAHPGTHSYVTLVQLDNVAAGSITSANWRF
jgi:V8-like Glu-specific endopeptidase